MSLETELEAFIRDYAADKRQTVLSLQLEDHRLKGYAQRSLAAPIAAFAQQQQLLNHVQSLSPERQLVATGSSYQYLAATGPELVNELGFAEAADVYLRADTRWLVKRQVDGYIGWLDKATLCPESYQPSHRLVVPRAQVYQQPRLAALRLMNLSLGTALKVLGQEGAWLRVALLTQQEGFVRASLVMPLDQQRVAEPTNITSLAHDFLQTPYVWGGVTAWGLDCSGLVQTVFAAHGIALPRDSDQQEALGRALNLAAAKPADLVFFEGHVGIYLGEGMMIHANAEHMRVTIDPVHEVATLRSVRRVL